MTCKKEKNERKKRRQRKKERKKERKRERKEKARITEEKRRGGKSRENS